MVQRDIRWEPTPRSASAEALPPLSLDWDGADATRPAGSRFSGWAVPAGATPAVVVSDAEGERLRLRGSGRVELLGPAGARADFQLQHWLVVRAVVRGADSLQVSWRRQDQAFVATRASSPMSFPPSDGPTVLTVPLSSLRGIRGDTDAEQGVHELRLSFTGTDGDEVEVEVLRLAFVSDFDAAPDGLWTGRISRSGWLRPGVALRIPGSMHTTLTPGPADRLRFALASVGLQRPVTVTLRSEDGRLPEQRLAVAADGSWGEHAFELPAGRPLRLEVSVEQEPGAPPGLLLLGSALRLSRAATARPPIVLYVEDTLRPDHLSAYGSPHPTDPRLAAIAAEGVLFERAWSTSSWTRPAMSSLFTSLDPLAHGNRHHIDRLAAGLPTLTEVLGEAGYLTASFVTNLHAGAWAGLDRDYDRHGEPLAFDAAQLQSTLTSAAIREPLEQFLREHHDEQIFVYAHSLDPHAPFEPPAADVLALMRDAQPRRVPPGAVDPARWERETLDYDAEILHNDHQIGALDDSLRELGLHADTVFAFVSDHGEAFGEHGRFGHRQSLHEEEVRVPWIVRQPSAIPPGQRIGEPVSILDLAPTLAGLAGVASPADWQGRDLSSWMRDPEAARGGQLERSPRPLLLDLRHPEPDPPGSSELAAVLWPWKLTVLRLADDTLTPVALHDIAQDPRQQHELLSLQDASTAERERVVAGLLQFLAERVAEGPRVAEGLGAATTLDPAQAEWMRQMGYLGH